MRAAVCLLLAVGLLGEGCTDWRHTPAAGMQPTAGRLHIGLSICSCVSLLGSIALSKSSYKGASASAYHMTSATCVAAGPGVAARALHQASAEADAAASAFSAGSAAQVMVSWDSAQTC